MRVRNRLYIDLCSQRQDKQHIDSMLKLSLETQSSAPESLCILLSATSGPGKGSNCSGSLRVAPFHSYKAVAIWALKISNQAQFAIKTPVIRHSPLIACGNYAIRYDWNSSKITPWSAYNQRAKCKTWYQKLRNVKRTKRSGSPTRAQHRHQSWLLLDTTWPWKKQLKSFNNFDPNLGTIIVRYFGAVCCVKMLKSGLMSMKCRHWLRPWVHWWCQSTRFVFNPKKTAHSWSEYIHGASAIFAWHIARGETVTVLSPPPPDRFNPSGSTYYQLIEQPIIKGAIDNVSVDRICLVHPMVKRAEGFSYQFWPDDNMLTWIKQFGLRPGPRKWRATGKRKGKLEIKNMLGLHDDPLHSPITSKSSPITKVSLQGFAECPSFFVQVQRSNPSCLLSESLVEWG